MQSIRADTDPNGDCQGVEKPLDPERAVGAEQTWLRIRLDDFEDTLDALLALAKEKRVDVLDVPVADVTQQLLTAIRSTEQPTLESGTDFVLMASSLIRRKSKALLPTPPIPEEEPESTVDGSSSMADGRLKYLHAAEILEQKQSIQDSVWELGSRDSELCSADEPEELEVTLFDLVRTFGDVLERLRSQPTVQVDRETVSVASRIQYLREMLERATGPVPIRRILLEQGSPRALVATFLALLEMVRAQAVEFRQEKLFGEISVRRRERFEAAFRDGLLGDGSEAGMEYSN